jgi:hypothetical protein
VGVIALAGHHLVARQGGLGAAQAQGDALRRNRLHRAVDDIAFALNVFLILAFALRLADALEDDLLGRLGGNPAEVGWGRLHRHHVPELGARVNLAGVLQVNLGVHLLDFVHHFFFGKDLDPAGGGIHLDHHVLGGRGVDGLAISGDHGILERLENDLPLEFAMLGYFIECQGKFAFHNLNSSPQSG